MHVDPRREEAGRRHHHHPVHRHLQGRSGAAGALHDACHGTRPRLMRAAARINRGDQAGLLPPLEMIRRRGRGLPTFGDGLVPVVVLAATGEVLMFAYMNARRLLAPSRTARRNSGRARGELWRKGEENGNTMRVVELHTDCDQDAIWLKVELGGADACCHTGRRSCSTAPCRSAGRAAGVALIFVETRATVRPRRPCTVTHPPRREP